MTRFPVNRPCPITGEAAARTLGYIPAGLIGAGNPTYRPDALKILSVGADDEFPIVQGPSGFVFAGWLPEPDFLRRVYEDAIDHTKTVTSTIWHRRSMLELASGLLGELEARGAAATPLRLLDYGCGYGTLLRMLASRDVVAIGYEPSAARREQSREGGEILSDLDAVAARGPFDLFVCTEVLEHLATPRAALNFLRANAAPGALLAVTVPDCSVGFVEQALAGFHGGRAQSPVFNPWEHLNYFSAADLRSLLAEEGFRVVADLGRAEGARDACRRFAAVPRPGVVLNSLRIAKRALAARPSTQLICQCS